MWIREIILRKVTDVDRGLGLAHVLPDNNKMERFIIYSSSDFSPFTHDGV